MRKKYILPGCSLFVLWFVFFVVSAQDTKKMNVAEFEKRKMEYIRKEAALSQTESEKYFPLNGELSKKKLELYKQHRDKIQKMKRENANMSDEQYRALLENDVEVKLREAELDKEYSEKFEKVLSPEKLYKAQQAEKTFMQVEITKFRQGQHKARGKK
ncbi:hypothetical protein [Limibacterium fermenti]|uniref:hypothetical protein n=1 Tax=Limibacterium fermenti TaxID=3229863 RepID=UPI003A750CFE